MAKQSIPSRPSHQAQRRQALERFASLRPARRRPLCRQKAGREVCQPLGDDENHLVGHLGGRGRAVVSTPLDGWAEDGPTDGSSAASLLWQ